MKRSLIFFLLVCGISYTSASFADTQLAWVVTSPGNQGQIESGVSYWFKVAKNGWHLTYKERSTGINLGWGKAPGPNIKIEKSGGGKINCGDKVALRVDGGGYLMYKKRDYGINLVWSKEPVYEWELRNEENKQGTPVNTDVKIVVFNGVEEDFMEYCERPGLPVVNLGWARDCQDGWRAPGITNQAREWVPYIKDAVKYGRPLSGLL